ncbi:DUF362 domain-containing protein [Candidatus Woesearchaeota archaeon]|nr:DUF362 domain-containing protein [Candidatus Woesearchaeota archaeon]
MGPKVGIVRCERYDDVPDALPGLLELIGARLPEDRTVLVKPNALTAIRPEKNVTTHPALVAAVCRLLKAKGNRVVVGESSGMMAGGGTRRAMEASGIWQAAIGAGAEPIAFEGQPLVVKRTKGTILGEIALPRILFEADLVVNLPKLKTHMLTRYTGAIKNLYGCIPGGKKGDLHGLAPGPLEFSTVIVDLFQAMPKQLVIMDAVQGMEGAGPATGQTKHVGRLLVSADAPALDLVAARMIGFRDDEVPTNALLKQRGLMREPEVLGDATPIVFKRPSWLPNRIPRWATTVTRPFMRFAAKRPYIHENCTLCDACRKICPAGVISEGKRRMRIDHQGCILCYCCVEVCPYGAINLARTRFTADLTHRALKKRGAKNAQDTP